MISSLSKPMSGRKMGKVAVSPVQVMLSTVWEAT